MNNSLRQVLAALAFVSVSAGALAADVEIVFRGTAVSGYYGIPSYLGLAAGDPVTIKLVYDDTVTLVDNPNHNPSVYSEYLNAIADFNGSSLLIEWPGGSLQPDLSQPIYSSIWLGRAVATPPAGSYSFNAIDFNSADTPYVGVSCSLLVFTFDGTPPPPVSASLDPLTLLDPASISIGPGLQNDKQCFVYVGSNTAAFSVLLTEVEVRSASPVDRITELAQIVVQINVDAGIANSLDSKLDNAIAALDDSKRGDNASAVNMLSGFINSVEAQRGKKLTNTQADQLVNAAQGIIDALSQP